MATVKKQLLGVMSGTIGDFVQRTRYGKTVIYARPSKYKVSQTKQAKEGRSKFALSVSFAKAVNAVPELKQIWKSAKLDGVVAYNCIIKYNRNFIADDKLTIKNIITPAGVLLSINSLELNESELFASISLQERELKSLLNPPFNFYYVLYLFNRKIKSVKAFEVHAEKIAHSSNPTNNKYEIRTPLNSKITGIMDRYNGAIVFVAASKQTYKKNETYWTSTFGKEFQL